MKKSNLLYLLLILTASIIIGALYLNYLPSKAESDEFRLHRCLSALKTLEIDTQRLTARWHDTHPGKTRPMGENPNTWGPSFWNAPCEEKLAILMRHNRLLRQNSQ